MEEGKRQGYFATSRQYARGVHHQEEDEYRPLSFINLRFLPHGFFSDSKIPTHVIPNILLSKYCFRISGNINHVNQLSQDWHRD